MTCPQSTAHSFGLGGMPAQFNSSGFLQGEALSGLVPTNFTFEMHKIFGRDKFSDDDVDYGKLELSLRMASALLMAAIPIFHTILVVGPKDTNKMTDDGKPIYQFPDPVEVLSADEVYTTWRRLDQMASGISFYIAGTEEHDIAWCVRLLANDGSLGPDLKGSGSTINIGKGLYDSVVKSFDDETDIINQQASAFNLATTLIHELTHAAINASTPYFHSICSVQYYLGESACTTEVGFETEAWLYGGVIPCLAIGGVEEYYNRDTGKWSHLNHLLTATEYPCPTRTALYANHPIKLYVRRGMKPTEIIWNVSFLHIHQLFQDELWTDFFPHYGRKVLRFAKATGFRFLVRSGKNELTPVLWDTDGVIDLPGHYVDKTGMIRKQGDQVAEEEEKKGAGGLMFRVGKLKDSALARVFGKG
ncbi:hypothetical protein PRZ48_014749 [Zasmidium cellare]|uniref:Uncharacterized protein n=1 Tax=Zasmidium cellare TaxID=395010 RepID=A0ABR0DZM5_ZASCE|nr:hypothetical protein PRZ48_014749 [Zasmidium cellare]